MADHYKRGQDEDWRRRLVCVSGRENRERETERRNEGGGGEEERARKLSHSSVFFLFFFCLVSENRESTGDVKTNDGKKKSMREK